MAYPERYHIDALRKLRGDAFVTFPTADLTVRTVERVYSVPRSKAQSPDAFNAPQTIEYTDTELTEQHFTGGDANYIEVYQKWETLPGTDLITQTLGQADSLIPQKYKRLVRTIEHDQPVGPEYVMPKRLTGNQRFIRLAMETVAKRRLQIHEEIINRAMTPIIGGKNGEWGPFRIYESVVKEGTKIDEGFLVAQSTVDAFGDGNAVKITVKFPADLASRFVLEQQYNKRLDLFFTTKRYIKPRGTTIGTNKRDVKALDYYREEVIEHGGNITVLDTFIQGMAITTGIDMPDKLVSVTGILEKSQSDGDSSENGTATIGGEASVSLGVAASAQASAAIVPDAYPGIVQFYGPEIPAMQWQFYLPSGQDDTAVLNRLNTLLGLTGDDAIKPKPNFNPSITTLIARGGRVSMRVEASSKGSSSNGERGSSHSSAAGTGQSGEVGLTVKTVRISPTIHGLILASGELSGSESASASASASSGLGPSASRSRSGNVYASIQPTAISPTQGDTDWPTVGKYLWNIRPAVFEQGYMFYECLVVDAAKFPNNAGTESGGLYRYLSTITRLTGGLATDLDAYNIASLLPNTIVEVIVEGRGSSQWKKTLWDIGGTPTTNANGGIIKSPDWNASTMPYVLVRERGY